MALFRRHTQLAQTAYSGLKARALEQTSIFTGTPGSVDERVVSGRSFYYRQFYDAEGKKSAEYIGPTGDDAALARANETRQRIVEANDLLREAREVVALGYGHTDVRTGAILAALANRALFRAGAVLVGSHAFGALANELGVRVAAYLTEDVDIARPDELDVALPEGESFAKILDDSRVPLVPVPGFGKAPSTSYKLRGTSRLRVDLLVPARGTAVTTRPVPELRAHASALPYFGYLLEETADGIVLARGAVVPVRLPTPARMAWHKMLVAGLRGSTRDKRGKDLQQAATLVAVLAEDDAGALREAFEELPRGTRSKVREGAAQVAKLLEAGGHTRALESLGEVL